MKEGRREEGREGQREEGREEPRRGGEKVALEIHAEHSEVHHLKPSQGLRQSRTASLGSSGLPQSRTASPGSSSLSEPLRFSSSGGQSFQLLHILWFAKSQLTLPSPLHF